MTSFIILESAVAILRLGPDVAWYQWLFLYELLSDIHSSSSLLLVFSCRCKFTQHNLQLSSTIRLSTSLSWNKRQAIQSILGPDPWYVHRLLYINIVDCKTKPVEPVTTQPSSILHSSWCVMEHKSTISNSPIGWPNFWLDPASLVCDVLVAKFPMEYLYICADTRS
jgi:hypothetical protein